MNLISNIAADALFSSTVRQQSSLDSLSNQALSKGIDLYMEKNYKEAIKEFKRAVGLSSQGDYAVDASNYMANAYLQLDDTENAIKTYRQSVELNPYRDDTRITLGNLLYSEERFQEAADQYREAVRLNPTANNHYSLGQAYISLQQYGRAEREFNTVRRLTPDSPNGNFGLGATYSAQGRHEDAIREFDNALALDDELLDAYAEKGYAYADMGMMDEAKAQLAILEESESDLVGVLNQYIHEVDPPKFILGYSTDFSYTRSMRTSLSSLDAYLQNANASKTFSMKFIFDKAMDRESIENRYNWSITKASGSGPGEAYNFGLPASSSDTNIFPYPDVVYYDSTSLTATIQFTLTQNEAADGTIDPSHLVFKFSGEDQYGYKMDPEHDEYSGFSRVA